VPVVRGNRWPLWLAAALALGCGGGEQPLAAGQPAVEPPAPTATQTDTAVARQAQQAEQAAMALSREAFAYRGGGRDPFLSLLRSGSARPMPQDLRVRGINYDPRYPQRSVATLQDTTDNHRYVVRPGDVLGHLRIVEIRPEQVIAVIEEFGVDRQFVLTIRRRQEDIP
jgi:hypothetical protein